METEKGSGALRMRLIPARLGSAPQARHHCLQITHDRIEPLGFGKHGQEFLFEIEIEGKRSSEQKGKLAGAFFGPGRGISGKFGDFGMQTHRLLHHLFGRKARLVLDHGNLGLQKWALLVDGEHFEALDSPRQDVHAPIIVFLDHLQDFSRAAYVGDALFGGAHNAEGLFQLQTLSDHFFVARLEDVERQGGAGEQDEFKRKDRQQRTHGAST